ncbi:hypothetical protein [Actinomadura geliboluensis]|uniref:hypothetical protein n=1 Tax=Actinomadura geliboluensis TaxID=882440 RepID=UPI003717E379
MHRTPALLATAVLTLAALAVPGTAQADATAVTVSSDYDLLAKDRVVKFRVTAASASGVTGVRANMRYKTTDAEPYASVEFTRTSGTDNDGVWQAEFRPDVEARPGLTRVEVLITTADGATLTRPYGFYDCYTTIVQGVTATPAVIDIEHSDVTVGGRVMIQKDRESAPEPASGAEVWGPGKNSTTSGADGSFTLSYSGVPSAHVEVLRRGVFCGDREDLPLTVNTQSTEVTATMTPGSTVAPGAQVSVDGKVVRHGSTGPAPAADVEVRVAVPAGVGRDGITWVRTRQDGTFHAHFWAERNAGASGAVTVSSQGNGFLTGSQTALGTLNIRNMPQLSGFNPGPEPLPYGDGILAHGTLGFQPSYADDTKLPVYLEFSPDGKTWTVFQSRTLDGPGSFYFNDDKLVKQDGYWRVRYPGSERNAPLISWVDYIDVKYRTYMYNFNASPEPVSKGKTITVKGLLYRFRDTVGPGPGAKISVYFKASGTSTWKWMADTKTGSDGWFKKTFSASKDGTWMAKYAGSSTYIASNAPTDYVDVR